MKTKLAVGIFATSILLSQSFAADEHLEIKGFHAGMKRYELSGHLTDFCFKERCVLSRKTAFTVGGVKGRFLTATYNSDGEADLIEFGFDSLKFSQLQAALTEKYPQAACKNSEVITRLGLRVPQVVCRYETASEGIYVLRVAGTINRSLLFVMSAEKRLEVRDHFAAATRDL